MSTLHLRLRTRGVVFLCISYTTLLNKNRCSKQCRHTHTLFFGLGFDSRHLHCFAKASQCKHTANYGTSNRSTRAALSYKKQCPSKLRRSEVGRAIIYECTTYTSSKVRKIKVSTSAQPRTSKNESLNTTMANQHIQIQNVRMY